MEEVIVAYWLFGTMHFYLTPLSKSELLHKGEMVRRQLRDRGCWYKYIFSLCNKTLPHL